MSPPSPGASTKKPPRLRGGYDHLSASDYFDGPLPGAVVAEPPAPLAGVDDVPGLVAPDMLEPGEAMPVGLVSGVVLPGIAVPGIMFPVAGVLIVCAEAAPLIITAKAAARTKLDFMKTPVALLNTCRRHRTHVLERHLHAHSSLLRHELPCSPRGVR